MYVSMTEVTILYTVPAECNTEILLTRSLQISLTPSFGMVIKYTDSQVLSIGQTIKKNYKFQSYKFPDNNGYQIQDFNGSKFYDAGNTFGKEMCQLHRSQCSSGIYFINPVITKRLRM